MTSYIFTKQVRLKSSYSEIHSIALRLLQTSKGFWVFCSVNHFSEGGVNAKNNVTCSSSLAENDSGLLSEGEGNSAYERGGDARRKF